MRFLKCILPLAVLFSAALRVSAAYEGCDYGLTLRSRGTNIDERTSFNLSSEGAFGFRHGFTMEFDMRLNNTANAYGYVFRVIAGNMSVDLLSHATAGRYSLILSDGHSALENIEVCPGAAVSGEWKHVRLDVSENGAIDFAVDTLVLSAESTLTGLRNVEICFGRNDHSVFYTSDVPPVSLREVSLSSGGAEIYRWSLFAHADGCVYDSIAGRRADASNAIWEIDSHCQWKETFSMSLTGQGSPLMASDAASDRIFIATRDSLYIRSMSDGSMISARAVSGTPVLNAVNQMFYDPASGRLVCYSMHGNAMAFCNPETAVWTGSFEEPWPPLTGHCRWYDSDSGQLWLFGGYGNHRYYADMTVIDIPTGERTVYNLSQDIWPRYFSSMYRTSHGDLIILGGYGNRSGLQEESPGALYDISTVDSKTVSCRGSVPFVLDGEPMIFASSMVADTLENEFYALAFSNNHFKSSLNLVSFSADDRILKRCSMPVSFNFHDTDAYADLLSSPDGSQLRAVVVNTRISGANEVKVWSLDWPPVPLQEIMQEAPLPKSPRNRQILICAFAAVLLLSASAAFLLRRRNRLKPLPPLPDPEAVKAVPHTVCLLGGLKILDGNGNDTVSRLSPLLRQMFLYFLLRSLGSDRSVTTDELNDVFWLGMEKSAAANNRNVNIKKLRVFLSGIGDITLTFGNDVLSLNLGGGITCDYSEIMDLIRLGYMGETVDASVLVRIFRLASGGTLLQGYEYGWLDSYKSEYSELLIGLMMKAAADPAIAANPSYMSRIADCILREDSLDEFAVRTKCRLLYDAGHHGLSRSVYEKWREDYMQMLDSEPEMSYKSIIKGED